MIRCSQRLPLVGRDFAEPGTGGDVRHHDAEEDDGDRDIDDVEHETRPVLQNVAAVCLVGRESRVKEPAAAVKKS